MSSKGSNLAEGRALSFLPFTVGSKKMIEAIGLIPAAGRAKRISPLPCSKELYPVGFCRYPDEKEGRPKVVCHYLLEKMRAAGITKAYIVHKGRKVGYPRISP